MGPALVTGSLSVLANIKPELRPIDIKELLNFDPVKPAASTINEEIQQIEYVDVGLIPREIHLPNWPRISISMYLGTKECFLVKLVGRSNLYQLQAYSGRYGVNAWIAETGNFGFKLDKIVERKRFLRKPEPVIEELAEESYNSSEWYQGYHYKVQQLNALYLFQQFQSEILSRAMQEIKSEVGRYSQGHVEARKVFEQVTQSFKGSLL